MHTSDTTEEERYRKLLALETGRASAVPDLIAYLGDPSWRVRKAAVVVLDQFRDDVNLAPALIAGLASDDNAGLRNACVEVLCRLGAAAVPQLGAALSAPDPGQRKFIAEVLGVIGTDAARQALFSHLDDPDLNVRSAVAEALGRIGGAETIGVLKGRLKSGGEVVQRVYLLDALVRCGARVPFEELAPYAAEPALTRQVLALLGYSGDGRAATMLLEGLGAPARATRAVAARGLASLLPTLSDAERLRLRDLLRDRNRLEQALVDLLQDDDDTLIAAVLRVLGAFERPELAPRILEGCSRRTAVDVGTDIVYALGKSVVAPLFAAFDRADVESRVLFLEIIEALGDVSSVPELLDIAAGPDSRSAEAALRVIGKLGDERALDGLMVRARDADRELSGAAAMALAEVGRRHPGPVAQAMRAALSGGEERPVWIMVLGILGRDEDRDLVDRFVHHRDSEMRAAAVDAAMAYGAEFPESTLIFALADEQPTVRAAAARALGAYRSPAAMEALLATSRDADAWVAAAAVRGLGGISDVRVVATLMDAASSSSSPIAIGALQSLFRVNPPHIARAVERALEHADAEVAREGVATAMRLGAAEAEPLLIKCLAHRSWSVRRAAAEQIANRGLKVSRQIIHGCLIAESEPLVQDSLERLLTKK